MVIAPEAGLMFMVVRVNQNTQNYSGCRKRICTRLRLHNLGDFMKTISAFIFLVLFSFPAHAQYKCHGDPVCRANRDGHSVEKARNCTVAKCIKNQATRGYTAAQASNWCPNNLHKGCN